MNLIIDLNDSQNSGKCFSYQYQFIIKDTIRASKMALVVKNLPANEGDTRDLSSILGSGRSLVPEHIWISISQFSSVQSLNRVWLFVTPWTAALQASLSITNSQSLLKLMSIELVMPSNHLILCCPLLLLPSIFPRGKVFSNKSVLHIRCKFACNCN